MQARSARLHFGPCGEYGAAPIVQVHDIRDRLGALESRAELDLDRTRISARKVKRTAPGSFVFTELELEHAAGDAGVIAEIAEVLRDRVRLVPSQFSKFDRGIQAAGLSVADASRKHREAGLTGCDRFLDLLYRHIQYHFARLRLFEPLALELINHHYDGRYRKAGVDEPIETLTITLDEAGLDTAAQKITSILDRI